MQMCYMAKTEVEHHTKPPDWEFLEENAERMAFVFCHKEAADIWAPIHLMVCSVLISVCGTVQLLPVAETVRKEPQIHC